jgi:hypothetical protein
MSEKQPKEKEETPIDFDEEKERLKDDKDFWESSVSDVIEEGASEKEADKAIDVADKLLDAKRERFPL